MDTTAVIEIHDAGMILADAAGVRAVSPGVAVLDGNNLLFGERARTAARLNPRRTFDRYWEQLDQQPLTRPAGPAQSHADLAYFHLREVWNNVDVTADTVLLAAPAGYDNGQLALLLGIVQACDIPVAGLVAASVAAAAAADCTGPRLLLDAHLHRITAVRIDNGDGLHLGEVRTAARRGLAELYDAWAGSIAQRFVHDTRFDPLHQAATEQALYDHLPRWLAALDASAGARLELATGIRRYHIDMDRAALAQAAEGVYAPLAKLAADADCQVVVSHRLACLPGLLARVGAQCTPPPVVLPDDAVARAALAHIDAIRSDASAPAYVTRLPKPVAVAERPPARPAPPPDPAPEPTHLLCGWRAYALGAAGLALPPGAPRPVARLSVRSDGAFVNADDAGVTLNGRALAGEARVAAGDRIDAGGCTHHLIAAVTDHGTP